MTTDLPYTDNDLRTEAARYLGDDMDALELLVAMADRAPWDRLATGDFNTAHSEVVRLIEGAPDTSEWAIALGVAGLEPGPTYAWRSTGGSDVAIQIATSPQLIDAAREELAAEIHKAVDAAVRRVLGCTG